MKLIPFGNTGLRVSQLALGTGMFTTLSGSGAEPTEAEKILNGYSDAGGNFIDTSDAYQLGQAETVLGDYLKGKRNDFVLASKYTRGSSKTGAPASVGNHRKAMMQSVELSLKRLKTDHIDLYFAHLDDGLTPIDEIVRGFDDLVSSGKIIYGGLSNFPAWRVSTAATIAALRGWSSVSAIQVEYNLFRRDAERDLLPMANSFSLGVMAYSPLAGGALTGKYRKGENGRASGANGKAPIFTSQQHSTLDALEIIATELAATPADIATAWVLEKNAVAILGARNVTQLQSNLKTSNISLTKDQLARLDRSSQTPPGYPHDLLATYRPSIFGN